ncbi:hypothetical protein DSO57_1023420 [Entomophthora muscae]|uniref:Uncharacterized protein n=1 Tax=Entomophthora muscae TaxID=34485 RepID=A0ACC2TEX5_9FUNG|nr:hypothetical protein DSO57_1023420 [Entomophthora muscae]
MMNSYICHQTCSIASELVLGLSPRNALPKSLNHAPVSPLAFESSFGPDSITLNIFQGRILVKKTSFVCSQLAGIQPSDVIGCHVITYPKSSLILSKNGIYGPPVSFETMGKPQHISLAGTKGVHILFNFGQDEFLYSPASPHHFTLPIYSPT